MFSIATLASSTYTAYTSYAVTSLLTITSPSSASGPIETTIAASAAGLEASAFYNVFFAGMYQETLQSNSAGAILSISFTVPTVPPGAYNITLDLSGTKAAIVSAAFTVTSSATLSLSPVPGDEAFTAFPGQIVTHTWSGLPGNLVPPVLSVFD